MDLVTALAEYFVSRSDVYAEAFEQNGRIAYRTVREPLSHDVLLQHVEGVERIGVYALTQDSQVKWFAVDFDGDKDEDPELAFKLAFQEATAQAEKFEEAGLVVYLERSRSGRGIHLWGFLDEFVPAQLVRRALLPLLIGGVDTYDRLYPVQDTIAAGKFGNLIALPFHGESVKAGKTLFLDRDGIPIPPEKFLESLQVNYAAVLEEVLERAPKRVEFAGDTPLEEVDMATLRPESPIVGWLKLVSPYGCRFLRHCYLNRKNLSEQQWWVMIGQATCFQQGREIAHLMSRDDPRYTTAETNKKYDHALQNPPHGCAYIRANWPELACDSCTRGAPYHKAGVPITELVQEANEPMEQGGFNDALVRIRRRQQGIDSPGVKWNSAGLDNVTRLRRMELTVIGAQPSVGKTALMIDGAIGVAAQGTPVFLFSAETGRSSLQDRLLAHESGVDSRALKGERTDAHGNILPLTEHEERRLVQAASALDRLPIHINYTAIRADQVLSLVEETLLRNNIALDDHFIIMFDYLQFGARHSSDQSDYDRLSRLVSEFKFIAKMLNQSVVVLSQLRRETEGNDEPDMTWFKGTGRIEADADVAFILTGERVHGPVAQRTLHIVKQKEGQVGEKLDLKFWQSISKFEALPHQGSNSAEKGTPLWQQADPLGG